MRLLPRPTASSAFRSDPGWKMWLGKRACSQRKESRATGTDLSGASRTSAWATGIPLWAASKIFRHSCDLLSLLLRR
jgi:hypothetical protein